jgi:DnaJ-class molecular chaperone
VTLPERTNPNFLLRVQGKGFHLSEHEVGDLMIRLVLTNEVVLPQAFKEQLQQYKQQKNDQ